VVFITFTVDLGHYLVTEQRVVFGGLTGQISDDDVDFVDVDPDIQRMFYGDDDAATAGFVSPRAEGGYEGGGDRDM
jgi:hypothetical protein